MKKIKAPCVGARNITVKYLRALRKRSGMSQGEFADRLGISVRTLQDWEQGRRNLGPLSARFLAFRLPHFIETWAGKKT